MCGLYLGYRELNLCVILLLTLMSICKCLCVWKKLFRKVFSIDLCDINFWPRDDCTLRYIWAASRQNQHNGFATSMGPDQRSLIRIHAVRLQILLQVEKLIANSMNSDQTTRMRRRVWIHAGRKPIMFVLSWRGSYNSLVVCRILITISTLFYINIILYQHYLLY
jgi:hypothetical protein